MSVKIIELDKALELSHGVDLCLHFEDTDFIEKTNSAGLLHDLVAGKYSQEDLEKFGYICLWSDYEKEQTDYLSEN